jgi:hypothetical protein
LEDALQAAGFPVVGPQSVAWRRAVYPFPGDVCPVVAPQSVAWQLEVSRLRAVGLFPAVLATVRPRAATEHRRQVACSATAKHLA